MLVTSISKEEELVEFRLDLLEEKKPVIYTYRRKEGLSEEERLRRIELAMGDSPAYFDLETDTDPSFIAHVARKFPEVKLIGSHHDFEKTPDDLEALFQKMQNPHFHVYKMALKAGSTLDMLRLMFFLKGKKNLSAISLGEYGRPSRVIAPILGSVLNYAGVEDDPVLHRYSAGVLRDQFHYSTLGKETKIYALIGDPVEQSPGEKFHNGRFNHNAVYLKMRLKKEELASFFTLAKQLPFGGLSVTMPLKEAIVPHLDHASSDVVNTVTFRNNETFGSNTDGPGALNAIEKYFSVRGKKIAILGAGGTAKAIASEATKRGATVLLFNRTKVRPLEELNDHNYDLLINTIPPPYVPPKLLHEGPVMDVVYHPRLTPLLQTAKGFRIFGDEMYVEQALLQQKEWAH